MKSNKLRQKKVKDLIFCLTSNIFVSRRLSSVNTVKELWDSGIHESPPPLPPLRSLYKKLAQKAPFQTIVHKIVNKREKKECNPPPVPKKYDISASLSIKSQLLKLRFSNTFFFFFLNGNLLIFSLCMIRPGLLKIW